MKKKLIVSLSMILALLASSCAQIFVKGNGNVTKKELPLTDFTGIKVSRGFNLFLTHDSMERVIIEIDENLQKYVKAEINSGILEIGMNKRIIYKTKMNVFVSAGNINKLMLEGGGNLKSENIIIIDKLTVDVKGGGNLNLELNTTELLMDMKGGGNAFLKGEINKNTIHFTGGGDLNLNVTGNENELFVGGGGKFEASLISKSLYFKLYGGCNAKLSGNVEDAEIQLSGGGNISASEMQLKNTKIDVSGGSNAVLKVENSIIGGIRGGGNLTLHGKPAINQVNVSGGSKLIEN